MPKSWNLQDAKARLSELVDRARAGEAQVILRRGEPAAVVIAYEDYQRIAQPSQTMLSFLQHAPLDDLEFQMPRDIEAMRQLE
jgi:antitoxin Phd